MRTSVAILGVAIVVGLSILAVESRHFSTKAAGTDGLTPSAQTASEDVKTARPASSIPYATDNRREIETQYRSAASISSAVERDKEYAALAGYAAAGGDFELAIEIADNVSSAAGRDESYARIVYQAMTVGDFASADKSAEKISSPMLREEQFKKIAQSCPSNTTTEGTASNLGLTGAGSDPKKSAAPFLLRHPMAPSAALNRERQSVPQPSSTGM